MGLVLFQARDLIHKNHGHEREIERRNSKYAKQYQLWTERKFLPTKGQYRNWIKSGISMPKLPSPDKMTFAKKREYLTKKDKKNK